MSTRSPMVAKTAKARKMDMIERKYVQARGDCADYQRGRVLLPYGYGCKRGEEQAQWAYAHALTPMEQWAVSQGYAKNPFADRPNNPKRKADEHKSAVYYADGKRRVFLRSEDAYENFESREDAVKLWDGYQGRYTLMR